MREGKTSPGESHSFTVGVREEWAHLHGFLYEGREDKSGRVAQLHGGSEEDGLEVLRVARRPRHAHNLNHNTTMTERYQRAHVVRQQNKTGPVSQVRHQLLAAPGSVVFNPEVLTP